MMKRPQDVTGRSHVSLRDVRIYFTASTETIRCSLKPVWFTLAVKTFVPTGSSPPRSPPVRSKDKGLVALKSVA